MLRDNLKNQGAPDLKTGGIKPAATGADNHRQRIKPLPETDYQRWYGRLVSGFNRIGEKLRKLTRPQLGDRDPTKVFDAWHQAGQHRFHDAYHRSLYDYKIAASMQLHHIAKIKEVKKGSTREITLNKGSELSTLESIHSLKHTLNLSSVQLCYRFLLEGYKLPPAYLSRALRPHFEQSVIREYGLSIDQASQLIESLCHKVGLIKDRDITFERILELKNAIRWELQPDSGNAKTHSVKPVSTKPIDLQHPALTPPILDKPGHNNYQLDEDDKTYIQDSVDKGGSLKIPKHDLMNRLKRRLLHSKRTLFMDNLAIIVGTAISAAATAGVSAGLSLIISLGWYATWNGMKELIRMVKVIKAMKKMETSADFALNPNDMEALKGLDEKKFKTFMKYCQYVCSTETVTRIYNNYAELEKDVIKSAEIAQQPLTTASDAIRFEEIKARYRYRKKNLDISFDLFNRLYTGAIGDMKRMEHEWVHDVQLLWG